MISAPGKILWIGSYSVVFGGLSHVIAVDRRVRCEVVGRDKLLFETSYGTFTEGNDLVKSVISVVKEKFGEFPKMHVKLMNDPGFEIDGKKVGLGSSAAATVALTACAYKEVTGRVDVDEVYKLSQKANYIRQRGIGSGFDVASATYGSVVYRRFTDVEKMDSYVEPLKLGNYDMVLGFTGRSASTVNLVEKFVMKSEDPKFKEYMEELDRENKTAINLLKLGKVDEACVHVNNAWNFLNYVAEEVVGVKLKSERDEEVMEVAMEEGAWVSIMPGAAGGDVVFALGKELEKVRERWAKMGIKVLNVKESEGGLKVEE
ncbi:MAG: GHMP kinase [Candidatus Aramenus sulfurataquae]|uniref:phosphomevalonate kinase n=1 Tax=Candidatus Aramenus sulfurataquae TaxID=1326980 RepID=W7KLT6_9CREN|nr:MAG: GHMP kinase [Candidatus Aramenus sulfurataquae]